MCVCVCVGVCVYVCVLGDGSILLCGIVHGDHLVYAHSIKGPKKLWDYARVPRRDRDGSLSVHLCIISVHYLCLD